MYFILIFFSALLGLSGCLPSSYPNLRDVPEYTEPSLSLETAKKEIKELQAERNHANTKK